MIATHQLPLSVIVRFVPSEARELAKAISLLVLPGKYGGRKIEGGDFCEIAMPSARNDVWCGRACPEQSQKWIPQKLHPLWLLFTFGSSVILTLKN